MFPTVTLRTIFSFIIEYDPCEAKPLRCVAHTVCREWNRVHDIPFVGEIFRGNLLQCRPSFKVKLYELPLQEVDLSECEMHMPELSSLQLSNRQMSEKLVTSRVFAGISDLCITLEDTITVPWEMCERLRNLELITDTHVRFPRDPLPSTLQSCILRATFLDTLPRILPSSLRHFTLHAIACSGFQPLAECTSLEILEIFSLIDDDTIDALPVLLSLKVLRLLTFGCCRFWSQRGTRILCDRCQEDRNGKRENVSTKKHFTRRHLCRHPFLPIFPLSTDFSRPLQRSIVGRNFGKSRLSRFIVLFLQKKTSTNHPASNPHDFLFK